MKTMAIEDLVRWAVLEEWPKAREIVTGPATIGNGWSGVGYFARLLTVIDLNAYGIVPDLGSQGAPHPDAAALGEVIAAFRDEVDAAGGEPRQELRLAEVDPDWLIGDIVWRIAVERGDDVARRAQAWLVARARRAIESVAVVERDGALVSRLPMRAILVRHAVLGAPQWRAGDHVWEHLKRPNGTAIWRRRMRSAVAWNEAGEVTAWGSVEVDAHLVNGRRPADAYPVEGLTPDPLPLLEARAAHVVWRSALRVVAERLGPMLVEYGVADDDAPSLPWLSRSMAPGRVLPDLGANPGGVGGHGRRVKENRRKGLTRTVVPN